MTKTEKRYTKAAVGELVVPAIMLLCVGVYWMDAAGLSIMALAFPMALTAIVVLASTIVIVTAFTSPNHGISNDTENIKDRKDRIKFFTKTWMIVLLPIPLIYIWREIGAIPVLFFYVLCVLIFLGERKRLWLIVIPSILAVALVYLFKTVLYVRLPDIPWLFGS